MFALSLVKLNELLRDFFLPFSFPLVDEAKTFLLPKEIRFSWEELIKGEFEAFHWRVMRVLIQQICAFVSRLISSKIYLRSGIVRKSGRTEKTF